MKPLFIITLLIVCSCQNRQSVHSHNSGDTIVTELPTNKLDSNLIHLSEVTSIHEPDDKYLKGYILIPNSYYRIDIQNEIGKKLDNGNWLELYKDKDGYKIDVPIYKIENEEEEPCSGMPTQAIVTDRNSLLLLKIPSLNSGSIDSIAIKDKVLSPNKTLTFSLNSQTYTLEAKGVDPLKYQYRDTPNAYYLLTLSSEGNQTNLLYQNSYNDTVTEILFIGDLDKDGKPDFILSSPRDYEEERIILILSADGKQYEESRQFDC